MAYRLIADDVLNILGESAVILSPDGRVEQANIAFLSSFKKAIADVQNRPLWELGGIWANSSLGKAFDYLRSEPEATLHNVEVEHDFQDEIGVRHLRLNARRVVNHFHEGHSEHIFLAIDDITERSRCEIENRRLRADAMDVANQRNLLLKDVFSSATEGRMTLCLSESDLPVFGEQCTETIELSLSALKNMRGKVREMSGQIQIPEIRVDDFESAVGEAAMNAVIHGGGGIARIYRMRGNAPKIQILIKDNGPGISVSDLPRAVLETGFSSKGTMGQGFRIILRTIDHLYLLTGNEGTTLILEQGRECPTASWLLALEDSLF
ncbi:MAG: ATP-binding protein [Akkermansiaceae bacterium]|nr:ATP-binding protein [Armatimonadota bacterium]